MRYFAKISSKKKISSKYSQNSLGCKMRPYHRKEESVKKICQIFAQLKLVFGAETFFFCEKVRYKMPQVEVA